MIGRRLVWKRRFRKQEARSNEVLFDKTRERFSDTPLYRVAAAIIMAARKRAQASAWAGVRLRCAAASIGQCNRTCFAPRDGGMNEARVGTRGRT